MANEKDQVKKQSFNEKSQQPPSESHTLTSRYMQKTSSGEVKNNLREVEATYAEKKNTMLLNQQIQEAQFLKGEPQRYIGLGEMDKNKKPSPEKEETFYALQAEERETFETKWQQKAELAFNGKDWRGDFIKDQTKTRKSSELTATVNRESNADFKAEMKGRLEVKRSKAKNKGKDHS